MRSIWFPLSVLILTALVCWSGLQVASRPDAAADGFGDTAGEDQRAYVAVQKKLIRAKQLGIPEDRQQELRAEFTRLRLKLVDHAREQRRQLQPFFDTVTPKPD